MMFRLLLMLVLGICSSLGAETKRAPYPVNLTPLPSPAIEGSQGPSLIRSEAGDVYLSWLEQTADHIASLYFARFEPQTANWSKPRQIATGEDWFINWADFPTLAITTDGRLTATWFVNNPAPHGSGYQAWISQSEDRGVTWSEPTRLTSESTAVEFVSLQPLAQGGLLAVWLDGRGHADEQPSRLYGRVIGSAGPDILIDDSVCDCCQTSLTAFPNGDVLVAYRARREGEIRDIHTALFQDDHWTEPRILSADEWRINGCPVNGPQLDSNGGNVAAVWFTGADNTSRVYASASPDAGMRFLMPERMDLGKPLGRVDTVQLRDGSRLVTWLEAGDEDYAGIYLRRISDRDEIGPAVRLASTSQSRTSGFPRLALVKDYDATPAQLILAYTRDTEPSTVETLLITLPDLSTLKGREPCIPCDEQDANATRGYPVKGRIVEVFANDQVKLSFEEIPGVMRATTLSVQVESELQPKLPVGQSLLGRIEQRGREWWLFNVKLLGKQLR